MKPPINSHKPDKLICLVADCENKAVYLSQSLTSQRGYCRDHKALAMRQFNERHIDHIVNNSVDSENEPMT